MAKKKCGAKNRKGLPCGNAPIKGRNRCKFHGGRTTGPKTQAGKDRSKMNSVTHGVYVADYTEDELDKLEALMAEDQRDNLDAEIAVARIQLGRAWHAASLAVNEDDPQSGLEIFSASQTTESGGDFDRRKAEIVRRRPDMWIVVDRCLSRVGRLMEQKARILEVREVQERQDDLESRLPKQSSR